MAVFALVSIKDGNAIRVGSNDLENKSANHTAPVAASNNTKNETVDAQTLA